MDIKPYHLEQLQETIKEVVRPQLDNLLVVSGNKMSAQEADDIASRTVVLILIELATRLAENDDLANALSYRIKDDDESFLPDTVVDSVAGWLMAPESSNPLSGKTKNKFYFNAYGA